MDALVTEFTAAAARVGAAVLGKDVAVVTEPSEGYVSTPLEQAFYAASRALRDRLQANPAQLTADRLRVLLPAMLRAHAACDEYRARMMSAAGDYDNACSPVAMELRNLVDTLRSALESCGREGRYPLEELDPALVEQELNAEGSGGSCWKRPLYEHLVARGSPAWGRPFVRVLLDRKLAGVDAALRVLRESRDHYARISAVHTLVLLHYDAGTPLRRRIAAGLTEALQDKDSFVSYQAQKALGGLGAEAAEALVEWLRSGRSRDARLGAVKALEELVEGISFTRGKDWLRAQLEPLEKDKDAKVAQAVSGLRFDLRR